MSIRINEIFYSIQGESLNAGRPCVFIRVTGCNLRCSYCDTPYAYDDGTPMEIPEIEGRILDFECGLVEITGGEPLLQDNVPQLIASLLNNGYEVMLETNGSRDISRVDAGCMKIMDIKCPGSGESDHFRENNLSHLTPGDQVKFVIRDRNDYEYARDMIPLIPGCLPRHHVLLSPVCGLLDPATLSEWILSDHLPVRLHLQLHKTIWPDIERGV
jgi:7-carboxy-7-deazaguanine synthase